MFNIVKITLNDKYAYYDAGVGRLQTILEVLGLRQLTEWKKAAERSHVSQKFAEAWECDYESPYHPDDLKLILKGAELAAIPEELKGKSPEDFTMGSVSYTKLCDVDVWSKVGFSILSSWDKVYSRILARKMRVAESALWELGIQEWKTLLEAASQDKVEHIRRLEHSILTARTAE